MSTNLIQTVKETILEVLEENGLEKVTLEDNTNILRDTPLDSLGLAVVVVKLEETTDKDPFSEGFVSFNTIGELAALYES